MTRKILKTGKKPMDIRLLDSKTSGSTNKDKSIFITIPAYNDPSLIRTIESALDNALFRDRLFFCIAMQYDIEKMPEISNYLNSPNFKFLFYDVETRPGVYWIRREMAEQHSGQDYFLMIDSHMVFAKYWDAKLINDYDDLRRLHGDRVIISRPTLPKLGDTIENELIHEKTYWRVDLQNDPSRIDRTILPGSSGFSWDGERYQRTLYACNHFFFTSKDYLFDVGFFKGIRFYTEEFLVSVASFMSGWDIYFLPEHILIGHDDAITTRTLYDKEIYSLASGKVYQAVFETEQERLEISKLLLSNSSRIFRIKNQRRDLDEFYSLAGKDVEGARELFKNMLDIR